MSSEEETTKQRKKGKGQQHRSYGMLGKKHSQETKDKISTAKKGQKYQKKRKEGKHSPNYTENQAQNEQIGTISNPEQQKDEEEEHDRFFMNTLREIRLMSRDIFSYNSAPLREQPDILRKIRILNYALAEWNDEYERRYPHLLKKRRSKEEILNEIFSKYGNNNNNSNNDDSNGTFN
jgi:NUMOD3 motif